MQCRWEWCPGSWAEDARRSAGSQGVQQHVLLRVAGAHLAAWLSAHSSRGRRAGLVKRLPACSSCSLASTAAAGDARKVRDSMVSRPTCTASGMCCSAHPSGPHTWYAHQTCLPGNSVLYGLRSKISVPALLRICRTWLAVRHEGTTFAMLSDADASQQNSRLLSSSVQGAIEQAAGSPQPWGRAPCPLGSLQPRHSAAPARNRPLPGCPPSAQRSATPRGSGGAGPSEARPWPAPGRRQLTTALNCVWQVCHRDSGACNSYRRLLYVLVHGIPICLQRQTDVGRQVL